MLLRNVDQPSRLYGRTRLINTQIVDYVLEKNVIGNNIRQKVNNSLTPSNPKILFTFQCKQFLIVVSFARLSIRVKESLHNIYNGLHLCHA